MCIRDRVKLLDAQRAEKARQEQLLRDALTAARAANEAKSDFLSRMSHDIRTPVSYTHLDVYKRQGGFHDTGGTECGFSFWGKCENERGALAERQEYT